MWKYLKWLGLALIVVCYGIFDLLMATSLPIAGGNLGGIILGLVFAQITVLAVWTAWAPVRVLISASVGLAGAALVSLAIVAGVGAGSEGLAIGGAAFLQWLAVQVPLWLVRLIFGRRLAWQDETLAASQNETQFGIRQLFAWTALVAVTLAVARLAVPVEAWERGRNPKEAITILLLLTVFCSLSAWPIIWAAFVRNWMPLWLLVAACCCTGICVAESRAFQAALNAGSDDEIFWWINVSQFVAAGISLLLVRFCGLRLVRPAFQPPGAGGKSPFRNTATSA